MNNDVDISKNAKALRRLRTECTKAKMVLSAALNTDLVIDQLADGEDCIVPITRAKFEQLNEAHF